MGFYIEVPEPRNKAQQIVELYEAEIVSESEAHNAFYRGEGVVCVVENPAFDAAGFMFDENELLRFLDPDDPRTRTWLVMDYDEASSLSGHKGVEERKVKQQNMGLL